MTTEFDHQPHAEKPRSLSAAEQAELDSFPEILRRLIDDERAVGNTIVAITHSHPAAPIGANVVLSAAVTTRPQETGNGLKYRENRGSDYGGSFTDSTGHFFVLEPPDPDAGAYPDMDAIRAAANPPMSPEIALGMTREVGSGFGTSALEQFVQSTQLTYDRWREGESYALALIRDGSEHDRKPIERFLISRGVDDWRDVEALAALGTPAARQVLQSVLASDNVEAQLWILDYAPDLVGEQEKEGILLRGIELVEAFRGLSQLLRAIGEFHPPAVLDALLKATLTRQGDVACHFAAMLFHLYGKSSEPFDWQYRPLFLRFNTPSHADRQAALHDLCTHIGVPYP